MLAVHKVLPWPVVVLAAVPTSAFASPEIQLPLKLAGHFPIVMARVDGLDVPLIFGTGDSPAVVLQQSVLDYIKAPPAPSDATSMGLDAKGNLLHFQKFRVSRLQRRSRKAAPGRTAPLHTECFRPEPPIMNVRCLAVQPD